MTRLPARRFLRATQHSQRRLIGCDDRVDRFPLLMACVGECGQRLAHSRNRMVERRARRPERSTCFGVLIEMAWSSSFAVVYCRGTRRRRRL